MASSSLQIGTSPISISVWVKPDTLASYDRIVANYVSDGGGSRGKYWLVFSGSNLAFSIRDSSANVHGCTSSGFTIPTGTWSHVAGVYDRSAGYIRLYIDGVQRGNCNVGSDKTLHSAVIPTYIGADYNYYTSQYFDGIMDEVRISNTVRSVDWFKVSTDLVDNQASKVTFGPEAELNSFSVTEPVSYDGGSLELTDTSGNLISSLTFETTLQIRDGSIPRVEFSINDDLDLSSFTVDDDSSRIVVSNLGNAPGVTSTHSLYVPDTGAGVYICPDAITLSAVAVDCSNVVTIASCPGTSGVYSCTDEGSYFKITGLTGSGVGTTCDDCADCDTGLYCDLRDGTPTCKNDTLVAAVACVDCVDNDADTLIDLDDPGCGGDSNGVTEIDGGGATIPEFNFVGYLLILVIAGIGLYFISRKS